MPPADPAAVAEAQSPGGNRVTFRNDTTVIEEGKGAPAGAGDDGDDGDNDGSSSPPATPLHNSPRLKGYVTLFVSALYTFIAASDIATADKPDVSSGEDEISELNNFCLTNLVEHTVRPANKSQERLDYALACSMITMIVTCAIILCHLDFCTPLRKNVWPKAFGQNGKVELGILLTLILFWCISTWLTTSIRGPAGEGKDQFNLYFSTWTCLFVCFWMLESWCTSTGRASFERFVRSWPNRCPSWIVTFILGTMDFLFALDVSRNWGDENGAKHNPYVQNLYAAVGPAEWTYLFFVTGVTFLVSIAWALAEIFRKSQTNVEGVKSDVETYVEGLTAQILCILWIVLVCIVTMPGGAASLLGNLYFTTWGTMFSVVTTLLWFLRDQRQDITNAIREEERKYESTKRAIRTREERRLAELAAAEEAGEPEESEAEEDCDGTLCEDDPVDDDITVSITSPGASFRSEASVSHGPPSPIASSGATPPADSVVAAPTGLLTSVLSYFYSADAGGKPVGDGDR